VAGAATCAGEAAVHDAVHEVVQLTRQPHSQALRAAAAAATDGPLQDSLAVCGHARSLVHLIRGPLQRERVHEVRRNVKSMMTFDWLLLLLDYSSVGNKTNKCMWSVRRSSKDLVGCS
jgi:hypothetical protein